MVVIVLVFILFIGLYVLSTMPCTVSVNTFNNWNLTSFKYESRKNEKNIDVVAKLYCISCAKHINSILRDRRFRGIAKKDVLKYVDGTIFISKHSVSRHLDSLVCIFILKTNSELLISFLILRFILCKFSAVVKCFEICCLLFELEG